MFLFPHESFLTVWTPCSNVLFVVTLLLTTLTRTYMHARACDLECYATHRKAGLPQRPQCNSSQIKTRSSVPTQTWWHIVYGVLTILKIMKCCSAFGQSCCWKMTDCTVFDWSRPRLCKPWSLSLLRSFIQTSPGRSSCVNSKQNNSRVPINSATADWIG